MVTKFGGKNHWPKRNALLGSKVMWDQLGSSRGQFAKQCPMATKFGGKNPWLKRKCIAGVEGHVGVSWGQVWVNLLINALWLPNFAGRTPDQSVMNCCGQRSCRGHPRSTRGQIALKCPMATKFGRKNSWPKQNALLGSKVTKGSAWVKYVSICLSMPYGHKIWWEEPMTRA